MTSETSIWMFSTWSCLDPQQVLKFGRWQLTFQESPVSQPTLVSWWPQEFLQWHFDGAEACEERLVDAFLHSNCRHSSHLGFHLIFYSLGSSEGSQNGGIPKNTRGFKTKMSFGWFGIPPWNRNPPICFSLMVGVQALPDFQIQLDPTLLVHRI